MTKTESLKPASLILRRLIIVKPIVSVSTHRQSLHFVLEFLMVEIKEKPHKLGFRTFRMIYQEYETYLYLLITKFVNVYNL